MKRHILTLTAIAAALVSASANAEYQWGFANVSMNYLDWTKHTTQKTGHTSHKDDFAYLELEGGAGFSWGELYGFADLENAFNSKTAQPGDNQRYTFKTTGRFYLGDTGFNLYGHVYGTYSLPGKANGGNFHEVNTLYGLGYNTTLAGVWFKPFVALHYVDQTFYSGNNGYVIGWVAGYDFNLWEQKFSVTNWNEIELNRNKRYGNGGRDGVNGALGLWWTPHPSFTAGIQYRYADNKLGEDFLQDGIVYSVKYNF
ncbi:ion channel protein Tsx [Xenorhabdus mauleonii]|uniref:Ion channel protein Tsx n=1 Tax=Xenorhabdus mauleonii TaxID=351675 RepID=A0A1I3Q993_9GAMM|nr:outer membrane protein OmpK [Xenorhabdus mauleonii]PHM40039.1 ion channel protein Tsx [Xenorhabdus mauleonii]SFJ30468.1 Nucleoside-specific channel-forming protein, Tsx [Xenorhabdus mauleonii]